MKLINTSYYPDSLSAVEFDTYLSKGWYRIQQYIFSISHLFDYENFDISRVWWLRFHINQIQAHRSHRRIRKLNAGFEVKVEKFSSITSEDIELYNRYYQAIDFPGYPDLNSCLFDNQENKNIYNTWTITVFDKGVPCAKAFIDLGEKAVMAEINFYDPAYACYSPSKFLILKTIDFMRDHGYEWYYPGYIVVNRPKFNYKLFLGKEAAEYYHPDTETWQLFCESILLPEKRTEEEEDRLLDLYFRLM